MRIKLFDITYLFIISCLYFSPLSESSSFSQEDKYSSHQVTIVYPDSIIKTYILNQKSRIKPREDKEYYWIYNQQIHQNTGDYSHYLINGSYVVYDLNGRLIRKGEFKYGLRNGTWKSWYSSGLLSEISQYKNGERQGIYIIYNQVGEPLCVLRYRNDKLDGKCEYHSDSDILIKKYKNGEEVQPWSIMDFLVSGNAKRDTIPDKQ